MTKTEYGDLIGQTFQTPRVRLTVERIDGAVAWGRAVYPGGGTSTRYGVRIDDLKNYLKLGSEVGSAEGKEKRDPQGSRRS